MNIGRMIKSRREELGMTQDELAQRVGLSGRAAISKIESGERSVATWNVIKFEEALKMDSDELFGFNSELIKEIKKLDSDELELLAFYLKITKEKQKN